MLTEEQLEGMYGEWLKDMACVYETEHYGHSRAAFYAGAAAMNAYLEGQGVENLRHAAAEERARIRSLLPYHVPCCENFLASVGDLVNEHGDAPSSTAN